MTDIELHNYFYEICFLTESCDVNTDISKNKNVVGWNAKDFWHQLSDNVYNLCGTRLINPTHICETLNPFAIHFTWDDRKGNILGCYVSQIAEIYVCFNNQSQNWREFLYLPKIQIPERLIDVIYSYYLEIS